MRTCFPGKGGFAKGAKARLKEVSCAVEQTHKLCQMKEVSLFEDASVSDEYLRKALHLVMQLDADACESCAIPRNTGGKRRSCGPRFTARRDALAFELERVLECIMLCVRKDKLAGRDAETVLREFDKSLRFSHPATEISVVVLRTTPRSTWNIKTSPCHPFTCHPVMPSKAPEKLLTVPELVALTGFHRTTITDMLKDPEVWAKPGGTKVMKSEFRLPVGFYNRWVDEQDLAVKI